MKLVRSEAESDVLEASIGPDDVVATCTVGEVEVRRALERYPDRDVSRKRWETASERIRVIELSEQAIDTAATVPPASLRSLDSIHLATALLLKPELDAFVVYDRRLADAATALGLPVSSPGAPQ